MILASELMGSVNEILARNQDRIPPEQLEAQRKYLVQQRLKQQIETKLVYQDARREIPAENLSNVEKRLADDFEKGDFKGGVKWLLKNAGVSSRQELDDKLRGLGTSLEREKRAFVERTLAQQWLHQKVKFDEEISHEQMLAYYREHLAELERPAQARWEELMVRFSKYPSKAEAYEAIARMGNQVLSGVALAEVAKARSDGTTAGQGGLRDWTTKGSLVSGELDRAVFGLPAGQLSQIIEDKAGLHIIRVIERKPSSRIAFLEAQVDIREKIRQQKTNEQLLAYLERLKKQIPVWTVFDERPEGQQYSSRDSGKKR